jgi:hypothetical protein
MSRLTANQLISAALARIGNDTITLDAQVELQNILDRLYEDYRWPFLKVTVTGSLAAGDSTVTLPADFADTWDRQSFTLYDSSGNLIANKIIPNQEFELIDTNSSSSSPFRVWHDVENGTLVLDHTTSTAMTYRLIYRKLPDAVVDFDAVVTFPNDSILIQSLFCWTLQFEDDDRYQTELTVLDGMLRRYIKRFNLSPDKDSRVALNPARFAVLPIFR